MIGPRVQALRVQAGLSGEALCRQLAGQGLSLEPAQLARLESGERRVVDFEVLALARVLGVAPEALFPEELR